MTILKQLSPLNSNICVAENDLERKSVAINLFGLDGDLRKIVVGRFYHSNSTMVDESPPARGRSRPRRLGAPPARRDRADQPPLRHCAARDATLEHVLRDDHASGSLRYQRGRALVKFNEIALTFESRAGGRHRCDMKLSLSTALALDAQSRR